MSMEKSSERGGVGGRSRGTKGAVTPCCSKVGLKRGPWTPEEDEVLSSFIRREGEGRWRTLPKRAGLLRCGKSCRLRWMNYLRPSVKRGHIAPDEEDLILRLHRLLGNRWSLIAGRIPGRTDNEIKNYWNTHLSKKLISQGIDPRTHKPLPAPADSNNTIPLSNPNPNPLPLPPPKLNDQHQQDLEDEEGTGMFLHLNPETAGYMLHPSTPTFPPPPSSSEVTIPTLPPPHDHDEDLVFSSFLNSLINDDPFSPHPPPPDTVPTPYVFPSPPPPPPPHPID